MARDPVCGMEVDGLLMSFDAIFLVVAFITFECVLEE